MDLRMNTGLFTEGSADVEQICSTGYVVTLEKKGTTDEFGELTSKSTTTVRAFPVRYSPFSRSVINKIAWASDVDVIAYISKKAQDDAGRDVNDLKKYGKMTIDNRRFDITYVEKYMACADDHLYYIIGGKKA